MARAVFELCLDHSFKLLPICRLVSICIMWLSSEGCRLTSQSYSDGTGMIRPRASSNLTGACAHVWRMSGSGSLCSTAESFSIISVCDFLNQLEGGRFCSDLLIRTYHTLVATLNKESSLGIASLSVVQLAVSMSVKSDIPLRNHIYFLVY